MCERCEKTRENAWAEIRDLLNYNRKVNGPLSEALKNCAAEIAPQMETTLGEDAGTFMEAIRAYMIAQRCAMVARSCPGYQFHEAPASYIMNEWAMEMGVTEIGSLFDAMMNGGTPGISLLYPRPPENESEE